jgi:site-specific DNA recombinase
MANAVIYARYSSHSQRDESIEDQVRVCREAAARAGDAVIHVYADRATTGTTTAGRAAFAEMLSDSERRSFSRVWVYKLDRFARNRYDAATCRSRLKRNGVEVVSATEGINDGPEGIILESVLEGMAEYYSANLSQNVKRGMHGNALRCMHNGVTVYGYDHGPDGRFVVNEDEAAVVRRVFEEYDSGMGMPEIADGLAARRTRRGGPFRVQTVSSMLRNEKYKGVYSFKDVRVEGGVPAIVDAELFDRVQRRLGSRSRQRGTVDRMSYMLTGKLVDVDGNRYRGRSGHGKNGRKYSYYECPETGHTIPKGHIEGVVAEAVAAYMDSDEMAERVADMVMREQEEALAADVEAMDALRARIERNESDQQKVIGLIIEEGETDALRARLRQLEQDRLEDKAELDEMELGTPVFDRDHVLFWIHEVIGKGSPEAAIPFASRVVIDREDESVRIEFVLGDGRTPPASSANGVRMSLDWLGQKDSNPHHRHQKPVS